MVVAYNADQRNGFAYIGAVMSSTVGSTGIGIAAMDLFITYLFTTWPFRKLYAELPQYNLPMLGNRIGHLLREEGRLKEHTYYNGRWWDQVIVALYPEEYFTESRVARLRSQ
jgi:RimJ/RimL family protein N-acetyltransferase